MKVKGWKRTPHMNGTQRGAAGAVLRSSSVDFKTRPEETIPCPPVKETIVHGGRTGVSVCTPSASVPDVIEQALVDVKGHAGSLIIK